MATKKGDAKFYPLLRAVNQYSYADYYASLLGYCCHNFAYRATRGKDVINDEGSLT
ncbi:unnamed protein product [marine sediment metagenome]|uniref:Uncharacterized protein n=1 Tax=marine sediment metagenome TaxID=412755 RepID=X1MU82_9ZZZZ